MARIGVTGGRVEAEIEGLRDATHRGVHLLSMCRSKIAGCRHIRTLNQEDDMSESTELTRDMERNQVASLITPTDLKADASRDIAGAMNAVLADVFALYLKTKNFHWHLSGPHFRDYHLLLDEQGGQLFAMTDPIAERVRKIGGSTTSNLHNRKRLRLRGEGSVSRG